MPRWAEARVPAGMWSTALSAIVARFAPATFVVDLAPTGATGEQVAVAIQDVSEDELRVTLLCAGVEVLHTDTRLGAALAA